MVVRFMRSIHLRAHGGASAQGSARSFHRSLSRASARLTSRQLSTLPLVAVVLYGAWLESWAAPDRSETPIDTGRSSITIHVYKAGLLSAFGHEHEIQANIERGTIDEGKPAVEFTVDSRSLRVMDRDISDQDRAEVQSTMLGPKVLDSEKFPEIRFHSTTVEANGPGKWSARGNLLLHGQTRSVTVKVAGSNGRYRGSAVLRQRDFGITPVTVAGGSIKVKDEIRIDFEIVAKLTGQ